MGLSLKVKIIGIFLSCLTGVIVYFMHKQLGFFYTDNYIFPGKCKVLRTPFGPEDLQVVGRYVISAFGDRVHSVTNPEMLMVPKSKSNHSGILVVNAEAKNFLVLDMEGYPIEKTFQPCGLNVYKQRLLYVINHDYVKRRDFVEVFNINEPNGDIGVKYLKTISFQDHYFTQLDDLLVIDENSFYITTWLPQPSFPKPDAFTELKNNVKAMFSKNTDLLYCTVSKDLVATCKSQDKGHMMNGIDTDGKQVFVADTLANVVNMYNIKPDRSLVKVGSLRLEGGGDNIVYDPHSGTFYVALLRTKNYLLEGSKLRNGEVARLPGGITELYQEGGVWKPRVIMMQDQISGLSTVVRKSGNFVLGSWIDNKILICPPDFYN